MCGMCSLICNSNNKSLANMTICVHSLIIQTTGKRVAHETHRQATNKSNTCINTVRKSDCHFTLASIHAESETNSDT